VEADVQRQGFNFVLLADEARIRQDPERLQLERLPSRQRYLRRKALIRVRQRQRDHYLESDEWALLLDELQPDILIIDEELPEAIIRIASLGKPMLLMQYFISTRWQPGIPPADSHLIPDGSLLNRIKITGEWLALWMKRSLTHVLAPLIYAGIDRRSIIRSLARQTGFDYRRAVVHHWFPILFPDIPTLFLSAPEFDFTHEQEINGAYLGPLVWPQRVDVVNEKTTKKLDTFLSLNAASGRPLIYCSLGTFWQMDIDYLQRVNRAFQLRPEWDLVLASGRGTAPDNFQPIPENVLVLKRVPQLQVLEQSDVVLTHGGIGTINECITYGVPMIVYSTGQVDQNGNAARVEHHGLGLRGVINSSSPETIAGQIAQVLTEPHFRTNVQQMQAIYKRYQVEGRAVAIVEGLL
jgi:hypothetical protein